jgi:hypothetical protein
MSHRKSLKQKRKITSAKQCSLTAKAIALSAPLSLGLLLSAGAADTAQAHILPLSAVDATLSIVKLIEPEIARLEAEKKANPPADATAAVASGTAMCLHHTPYGQGSLCTYLTCLFGDNNSQVCGPNSNVRGISSTPITLDGSPKLAMEI